MMREKLPGSVSRLLEASQRYVKAWVDLESYIDHASPKSSIDSARLRLMIAKGEFDLAVRNHNAGDHR